jgi:hypothetical protein
MMRRPLRTGHDDGLDPDLEQTVADLDRYLVDSDAEPSRGFADRVMEAVESEPIPRRGVLALLTTALSSERGRVALLAATVAVAVIAVLATGQLAKVLPIQFGGSPQPSQSVPASPEPSPSLTPLPSPSSSPSTSAEPSADGSHRESEAPDASDDADESPSPTDDNSGPGGGGDDGGNSGPGGGISSSPDASG